MTKILTNQRLDCSEVPVGEIFESPFAIEKCLVGCREGFDHGHEVAVVIHEFQLNSSQMAGIAGDGQRGFRVIALCLDQRLEAEAL